ncbi:hypothetical protein MTO96_021061 [Rhipicephalus appendiculatus]
MERLLSSLQNVTQLQFSLVDAKDDAKEELFKMRHLGNTQARKETKIRKMKTQLAFNYAQLRDLALSPNAVFPLEPVVLVAVDTPDLGRQFLIAGSRHNWSQIRSLCVLLYARNLDQTEYPTVNATHTATLRDFFATLLNLVELQRAVRKLALGLGDLEDLDVRLNLDGRHKSCQTCAKELVIKPADASAFAIESGRLTLSNVPNLVSLDFLRRFWVSHVRYIDDSDKPRFDYRALSSVLCSSRNIRSLVVRMAQVNFHELSFENFLCPLNILQRLCLLTKTRLHSSKSTDGRSSHGPPAAIHILHPRPLCGY